jgi:hypothetical protein
MAKRHDAMALLLSGLTLDEISRRLNRPLSTVIQDLRLQAGEGDLKLSEIFFAISADKRAALEALIDQNGTSSPAALQQVAAAQGFEWHELDLYCRLRNPGVFRGDLYEYLADTEVALHRMVRETLEEEFGPAEGQWWRQGVPAEIRKACVQSREDDPDPVHVFAYTTLIHLAKIIDHHWRLFSERLPPQLAHDKKRLSHDFARLNSLRNAVMHPVKGKSWGREEFAFVRHWHRYFEAPGKWAAPTVCRRCLTCPSCISLFGSS